MTGNNDGGMDDHHAHILQLHDVCVAPTQRRVLMTSAFSQLDCLKLNHVVHLYIFMFFY